MSEDPSPDVAELLNGVRAAVAVERIERGLTRAQRLATAAVVDRRLLAASRAGAADDQLAEALGRGIRRTRERVRKIARQIPAEPELVALAPPLPKLMAPNAWRAVPRCARPAPPPWPVSRACRADEGHAGGHDFGLFDGPHA